MKHFIDPPCITADDLKIKRKELGLTQKEFAQLLGVSKPTVERWEAGDKELSGPLALLLPMLTKEYLDSVTMPEQKSPLRLLYYYKNKLCTLIDVYENERRIEIKNYVKNEQFCAFGVNIRPTFDDYEEFLKSRCFPEERDGMKLILKDLNLPFYEPLMIIEKTEGRMAEDDFRVKVVRKNG